MRCGISAQDQPNQGFPVAEFVTVFYTGVATVVSRDILVKFTRAYRFFWIASVNTTFRSSDVGVHFLPLFGSTAAGANTFIPVGNENWFMLFNGNNQAVGSLAEARWFRTRKPVQQFFVDIDHPNGASGNPIKMTFGASDDIHSFFSERK